MDNQTNDQVATEEQVVPQETQPVQTGETPTTTPVPDQQTVQPTGEQVFIARYQQLVAETGFDILSTPTFVRRDDGTYSIVIENKVVGVSR